VKRFLDGRNDYSERPKAIVDRLLARIGMKLEAKRKTVNNVQFYIYWIDATQRQEALRLAQGCLLYQQALAESCQNAENRTSSRDSAGEGESSQHEALLEHVKALRLP